MKRLLIIAYVIVAYTFSISCSDKNSVAQWVDPMIGTDYHAHNRTDHHWCKGCDFDQRHRLSLHHYL